MKFEFRVLKMESKF